MGTAGLEVPELTRLLRQRRFDTAVIEDDRWGDHCVIRIVDMRHPHPSALLYYENMGIEPRLARLIDASTVVIPDERIGASIRALDDDVGTWHHMTGRRSDDAGKLVPVILDFMTGLQTPAS